MLSLVVRNFGDDILIRRTSVNRQNCTLHDPCTRDQRPLDGWTDTALSLSSSAQVAQTAIKLWVIVRSLSVSNGRLAGRVARHTTSHRRSTEEVTVSPDASSDDQRRRTAQTPSLRFVADLLLIKLCDNPQHHDTQLFTTFRWITWITSNYVIMLYVIRRLFYNGVRIHTHSVFSFRTAIQHSDSSAHKFSKVVADIIVQSTDTNAPLRSLSSSIKSVMLY